MKRAEKIHLKTIVTGTIIPIIRDVLAPGDYDEASEFINYLVEEIKKIDLNSIVIEERICK